MTRETKNSLFTFPIRHNVLDIHFCVKLTSVFSYLGWSLILDFIYGSLEVLPRSSTSRERLFWFVETLA